MKTFKQKSLYAALAGVGALGMTGAAQAVNVNPDGLGQVLIYPYYTARALADGAAPYASLLTVVNSTGSAKAVKVRFIEGKASQEVLDFNLFLSAKDVWTAGVLQVPGTPGAGVGTYDKSCTVPALPTDGTLQPFVNYAYADDAVEDATLDRTMEGYAEIIEMGTVIPGTALAKAVTHVNGVPPCTASVLIPGADTDSDPVNIAINAALTTPSGGLFGDMTYINVLAGTDYTADAVAIDNFRNFSAYNTPGSIQPTLEQVSPPVSIVVNSANTTFGSTVVESTWALPIDAISALFMQQHVYNDYVLDSNTKSGTDWVLTFPTKKYYYDSDGTVTKLFQSDLTPDGACDDISTIVYDREENTAKGSVGFSPPKPGAKSNQLCWEANVLTFNGSQVLGSTNNRNLTVSYQNGWADLSFPYSTGAPLTHVLASPETFAISLSGSTEFTGGAYYGLPVVGFAVQSYENGNLPETDGTLVQSNYGGNFLHKTMRNIVLGPLVLTDKTASK
ncbi:MAG: hypothetical protein JSR18_14305 [Proteobacteria bacterium]|nr:hypothetical protein [Pseudomonadota bacterium]